MYDEGDAIFWGCCLLLSASFPPKDATGRNIFGAPTKDRSTEIDRRLENYLLVTTTGSNSIPLQQQAKVFVLCPQNKTMSLSSTARLWGASQRTNAWCVRKKADDCLHPVFVWLWQYRRFKLPGNIHIVKDFSCLSCRTDILNDPVSRALIGLHF